MRAVGDLCSKTPLPQLDAKGLLPVWSSFRRSHQVCWPPLCDVCQLMSCRGSMTRVSRWRLVWVLLHSWTTHTSSMQVMESAVLAGRRGDASMIHVTQHLDASLGQSLSKQPAKMKTGNGWCLFATTALTAVWQRMCDAHQCRLLCCRWASSCAVSATDSNPVVPAHRRRAR